MAGGGDGSAEVLRLESMLARNRTVDCDEECAAAQRVRGMAEAFGIDPRLKHSILSRSRSPFPDRLLLFARDQPVVAQRVEKRMLALLDDPKADGVNLPPMPAAHRAFVHDLATMYHLRSTSFDPEPKRYVRVSKLDNERASDALTRPSMTLREAVARFGHMVDVSTMKCVYVLVLCCAVLCCTVWCCSVLCGAVRLVFAHRREPHLPGRIPWSRCCERCGHRRSGR